MGYVSLAMQETGFTKDEINSYRKEAMSGDYDNLLCVSTEYIDKCNQRAEKKLAEIKGEQMEKEAKYQLEQIQKLLFAIWAIEDKHNDEYSDSVKEIVNVCNDKIDELLGVEYD